MIAVMALGMRKSLNIFASSAGKLKICHKDISIAPMLMDNPKDMDNNKQRIMIIMIL